MLDNLKMALGGLSTAWFKLRYHGFVFLSSEIIAITDGLFYCFLEYNPILPDWQFSRVRMQNRTSAPFTLPSKA